MPCDMVYTEEPQSSQASAEQLNQLNDMVVKECVDRIMPEIKQYLGYREDVSKPREFMPLPQYLSESGKDTFALMK